MPGRSWVLAGALLVAGCSSLIGLDDFEDAPAGSGGAGGSGATGGSSPTGGAAGVAGSAPTGGAAGAAGSAPTGGAGGSGGTGATGGTGPGGTGGTTAALKCTAAPQVTLIAKKDIPESVSSLVMAADQGSGKAYVFVAHDFTSTPPSGRSPHELVGVRADNQGPFGGFKTWDVQGPIKPSQALVDNSGKLLVRGSRKSVEQLAISRTTSGDFDPNVTGLASMNLLTLAPQSGCLPAQNGAFDFTAFTPTPGPASYAARCAGDVDATLVAGTEAPPPDVLASAKKPAPDLIPREYWVPFGGGAHILLQGGGGFRVGAKVADLQAGPQFIAKPAAYAEQSVMGMTPKSKGVLVFLQRKGTNGAWSEHVAKLDEPYTSIANAPTTELPALKPELDSPLFSHQTLAGSILIGKTAELSPKQRNLRVVLTSTAGEIVYRGDFQAAPGDITAADAAPLSGTEILIAYQVLDGPLMGQLLTCQ